METNMRFAKSIDVDFTIRSNTTKTFSKCTQSYRNELRNDTTQE